MQGTDMIIDRKNQDCYYFRIWHTNGIIGHVVKNNLAYYDVEDIDLPIVVVSIASTL